jgi:hypothetical protein
MTTGESSTPTVDQIIALSQIAKAHDQLEKVIRRAMKIGVSKQSIIDFVDDLATQAANYDTRKILDAELVEESQIETRTLAAIEAGDDNADTVDQDKINDDDTVLTAKQGG